MRTKQSVLCGLLQMKQLNVADPQALPVCTLQRKHAFRSNRNTFEYNGNTYAWDYKIFVGAMHTLKNLETKEIIAVCQLKAGVRMQSVTAWGLRCESVFVHATLFFCLSNILNQVLMNGLSVCKDKFVPAGG